MGFLLLRCSDEEIDGNKSGEDDSMFEYEIKSYLTGPPESIVRHTVDSVRFERMIRALLEAMKEVVSLFRNVSQTIFFKTP